MIEQDIELPVCAFAEKNGWLVRKLQWIGRRGAPDRFFAKGGRVVLIEFKRPGGKPRKLQVNEINRLAAHGVEVYVVDEVEQGKDILR